MVPPVFCGIVYAGAIVPLPGLPAQGASWRKSVFRIDEAVIFAVHVADRSYESKERREGMFMPDVRETVTTFIRENFIAGRSDVAIDPDQSLIESGIMDSTGVLELVEYLETTFEIKVEDEELVPENLETVNNIVKFLASKGVSS
jgi:acyl carrier protein